MVSSMILYDIEVRWLLVKSRFFKLLGSGIRVLGPNDDFIWVLATEEFVSDTCMLCG